MGNADTLSIIATLLGFPIHILLHDFFISAFNQLFRISYHSGIKLRILLFYLSFLILKQCSIYFVLDFNLLRQRE